MKRMILFVRKNFLFTGKEKRSPGIGPFDKDPDDDIPFRGFEEDPEE
jgi:hypothetical protein